MDSDKTTTGEGNKEKIDLFRLWNYDAGLALKRYHHRSFLFSLHRRNCEFKDLVLNSDATAQLVAKVSEERKKPKDEVQKEFTATLNEIGHDLNLFSIRVMCFLISKVTKSLFSHLYVNKSGIEQLREMIEIAPIVFVPSHNSYFDFLLLSFACFILDLPLPAIASGQDFLDVAIVGRLFRGSGAFYMRRTFSNDECYKTLFKQYVMYLVGSGDRPVEFFLEGTRSRNGKAMQPKTGLLSMVNEAYYRGLSPDILFCPVSIGFECIPEENLYTYEMLGLPKPKESLSGVLKSKSILSRNFGEVNVHFGKVMSLEEISKPYIDRRLYTSHASELSRTREVLSSQEAIVNSKMARWLVSQQQKNMTVTPRAIIASFMLKSKWTDVSFETLFEDCVALVNFLKDCNCRVSNSGEVTEGSLRQAIDLLHPCVQLKGSNSAIKVPTSLIGTNLKASPLGRSLAKETSLGAAITDVFLSQQRNKILPHCYVPAFLCRAVALDQRTVFTLDEVFDDVKFLYSLMRFELVYHPLEDLSAEIERALELLERHDCVSKRMVSGTRVFELSKTNDAKRILEFLTQLFQPFFETYWFVCHVVLSRPHLAALTQSKLASELQLTAAEHIKQGLLQSHEALSNLTLKNAVKFLAKSDALVTSRNTSLQLVISGVKSDNITRILDRICNVAQLPRTGLPIGTAFETHKSKL